MNQDFNDELCKIIDEEVAKEYMLQYNFTEEQITEAKQHSIKHNITLTNAVIDINIVRNILKKV